MESNRNLDDKLRDSLGADDKIAPFTALGAGTFGINGALKTMADIKAGVYRHYKGLDYQVFGVSRHSETEEWLVTYRCLYGDYSWWVRPFEMFTGTIEKDGEVLPRFDYQKAYAAADYPDAPELGGLMGAADTVAGQ